MRLPELFVTDEEQTRVTRPVGIAGLGTALPGRSVPTADIAAHLGVEPEWILRRTGIAARRQLAAGETLTGLAITAADAALDHAGVSGAQVDAVLVATSTADRVMPHTAPLVAAAIGARDAMGWDVGLACTGFLAALEQGAALIEAHRARTVLVVAADALSRVTDPGDRTTAALFGDGAGAVVLTAAGALRLGQGVLRLDGGDPEALVLEGTVRMDGPAVFSRAIAAMERDCRTVLDRAGRSAADVDLVVPHQANARITAALRDRLGIDPDRVADSIAATGNTGAASIPLALAEAPFDDADTILLCAFGAGFASGALLLERVTA